MKERIKIGVLLNDYLIPSWQYKILKELANSDYAKIVFVIKNKLKESSELKSSGSIGSLLLKILERTDRLVFKTRDDYYMKKNASELIKDFSEIDLNAGNDSTNGSYNNHTLSEIKNINPDIILRFGASFYNKELLQIPKYGIWVFSIDDKQYIEEFNSGFWEVIRNYPITNSMLGILKSDSEEISMIFNSFESTSLFSINLNRNKLFWRASLFIPRILNSLYLNDDKYLSSLIKKFKPVKVNPVVSLHSPSVLSAARLLLNYSENIAKFGLKKLFYTNAFNWNILIGIKKGEIGKPADFSSFIKIPSPKGCFWADPFVVARNDNYYIFVEEFLYKTNKAHISILLLDNNGQLLSSKIIIERPYHMSYPFIFMIDNVFYMIPETAENNTISLYKCTDFPFKWEFDRNIMENISAVDTTIFYYNDKYWLFTSLDQTDKISGFSTELFLFFTDDFFSKKWKSHPLNPIVSDVRSARSAGRLFIQEGKIFRPSQDCSVRYGKGFNINLVTKLTETEYDEIPFSLVEPIWDKKLKGAHTYNFDKDCTVIDVYTFRKRFSTYL